MKPRVVLAAVIALLAIGVTVPVLAGHGLSDVDSYTGCLNTSNGNLSRFAVGDSPESPCPGSQAEIHVGGGDITEVLATPGGGLTGGGDNGSVALSLDTVPAARVRTNDPVPIDAGDTPTQVQLDREVFDTADMHDGDSAEITAPRDGIYVVTASVLWCSNPTGVRTLRIAAQNDEFRSLAMSRIDAVTADGFGDTAQTVSAVAFLHEGESAVMEVATTVNCFLSTANENSPVLAIAWIGPA